MIYLQLFFEFFKTGLFTIGGAFAAIPFLQEMALNTGWFTQAQLTDMIAVSESTPGPIGINMATYVGYVTAGFPGGAIASLGLITPSLIIVLIVAHLLRKFRENAFVDSAFYGLRPASVGLISAAGLSVLMMSLVHRELWEQTGAIADLFDLKAIFLAAILFFLTNKFKTHPFYFIAGSAAVGIFFRF
jgi:chromate transporter